MCLLGKISNDPIEGTFGSYRRSSGSTFLVSVPEVLESQAKLRVSGYSQAHKVPFGVSEIEMQKNLATNEKTGETEVLVEWFRENVDPHTSFPDVLGEKDNGILTFVAGYCGFKVSRKLSCKDCVRAIKSERNMLYQLEEESQFALIMKLNRGGLSFPTGFTITVARYCYFVFSIIAAGRGESMFLTGADSHRTLMKILAEEYLTVQCRTLMEYSCDNCGICFGELAKKIILVCFNTLLNGYQRKRYACINVVLIAISNHLNRSTKLYGNFYLR